MVTATEERILAIIEETGKKTKGITAKNEEIIKNLEDKKVDIAKITDSKEFEAAIKEIRMSGESVREIVSSTNNMLTNLQKKLEESKK